MQLRRRILALVLAGLCLVMVAVIRHVIRESESGKAARVQGAVPESGAVNWFGAPEIDVQLLTNNEYSRPGLRLGSIKGIVVHYTANPGSSAQANRNYFEGLKDSGERKASSHFVVGLDGEVIQCIPSTEISYASNDRNKDTLSIECCHPDETGEFNQATYTSLVQLTAWLCKRFGLESTDVIRHYDVTGKECPKYFVDHEDAWERFRQDVGDCKNKIIEEEEEQ